MFSRSWRKLAPSWRQMVVTGGILLAYPVHQRIYATNDSKTNVRLVGQTDRDLGMPVVSLGTSMPNGVKRNPVNEFKTNERFQAGLAAALDQGYRHIEVGVRNQNLNLIAHVFVDFFVAHAGQGIGREDLFITAKWHPNYGSGDLKKDAKKCLDETLAQLGLDYVDMFVLATPFKATTSQLTSAWKAAQDLKATGRVKNVGVAHFRIKDLQTLMLDGGATPAINQIEWHLYLPQPSLRGFCKQHGIQVQAVGALLPLTTISEATYSKTSAYVHWLAAKYGVTPSQVLLRWCLDHDVAVNITSTDPKHLRHNLDLFGFELTQDESTTLAELSARASPLRRRFQPDFGPKFDQ